MVKRYSLIKVIFQHFQLDKCGFSDLCFNISNKVRTISEAILSSMLKYCQYYKEYSFGILEFVSVTQPNFEKVSCLICVRSEVLFLKSCKISCESVV